MPHQISPPAGPAVLVKPAPVGSPAVPPSQDEVSSMLATIFTAKTSQESLDAAYALTNLLVTTVGFRGLSAYRVLAEVRKAAADKKDGARRESAQILLGALLERLPPAQPISEAVLLIQEQDVLPLALDALADKGAVVRESAQYGIDALFKNLRSEALVVAMLPVLLRYLSKRTGKWQGTVGAFVLLGKMADKAKMGMGSREEEQAKDVLREAMGKKLSLLIPAVEAGMHDLKPEVCGWEWSRRARADIVNRLQDRPSRQ